MVLATTLRYDRSQVTERDGHAVVVGASMAGLLAARVLDDAFERVTLIEKDSLPDAPVARPGVPQARHAHVLHEAGRATLEDLFPGYGEALISNGALLVDLTSDVGVYDEGDFIARAPTRLPMYSASRPLFEHLVRQRVAEREGIAVRDESPFIEYLYDERTEAVAGVAVREDDQRETLPAELVVDATGRTSRTPTWLEEHGYALPTADEVTVDLAYSTMLLDRPADDRRGFFAPPSSPRTRGAGVFPIEDDRWLLTLAGVHGDHPPTDIEEMSAFASTLPVPAFERLIENHEVRSDAVAHYPYPSNRRHHYWALDRFPDGLVVTGDAVASFNPIYGQGMSVAALDALHLHHTVAAGRDNIAPRFFERVEDVIDDAWRLAVGADFRFEETTGPKPLGTDLLNRYLSRLTRKAHTDGSLAEAYARVVMMERRPASLVRPSVLWRVLKPTW